MTADRQTIGGLLHAIEFVLESAQNAEVPSGQLIKAQRKGKPLAPATLRRAACRLRLAPGALT
jgi:hypothetical protein